MNRRLQSLFAYPSSFLAIVMWMSLGAGLLVVGVYASAWVLKVIEYVSRPAPVIVKPWPLFCQFRKAPTKTANRYSA
jgi:hypothetical protein